MWKLSHLWIICCLTICACTPKIVPVQMARVTQLATYHQHYDFKSDEHAREVLQKVLGKKNWDIVEKHYIFGDVVQDMRDGRFVVEGSLLFTMSLDPTNHSLFYIQGFGRYYVHRKTTNEIIFSADYDIINEEAYSLEQIKEQGYIELQVKRYYTRYFAMDEGNYYSSTPLSFRMYIKELKKDVYTVDYDQKHLVMIDNDVVGKLEFLPPNRHLVIDLRSLGYLRDDY